LKRSTKKKREQTIELALDYQPPMHWDALLGFFRSHQIIGVETIDEHTYSRAFRIGDVHGSLRVEHDADRDQLRLGIVAEDASVFDAVAQRVRSMFDLESDPAIIGKGFAKSKLLKGLWKRAPGLRVASGWDAFEVAICTILGQLVSVKQATRLVMQLVQEHGEEMDHQAFGQTRFFPSAEVLADAALDTVRTSPNRKRAIRTMAADVASGKIDFNQCDDIAAFKVQLLAMPGIGPWTAEYIGLRGMRDKDSFPRTDLFLKRTIVDNPELDINAVRPWRSYAAIYLWRFHNEIAAKA
jgi:AraC family transcriptional regulator of adaptative response / DNA-3-methyladenine glycosylase II